MVDEEPAFAAGSGLTETLTECVFVHPFELVSVRVYVVFAVGLTDALELVEVKPVGLLVQE
jgi:hypothetical protein